ncbi:lactoperoxidase-like [Mercenaria mercenaria]|uniref:lactoperoxidase-like n=1 Tax=Mercenaria mercenaria TaxID=6596 RepID=UPI00234F025D|nr:lactoperoxidase-like [Mercenaria mercenaria]
MYNPESVCITRSRYVKQQARDKRSNDHPSLTSYHTVFVREHNRIASRLGLLNKEWTDEKIFQETRKIVAAEIQHITLNEMLPSVLDSSIMSQYGLTDVFAYNPTQDASIFQAFSIVYRFHNMMPAALHFAEESGSSFINTGVKNQEDVFRNPSSVFDHNYHGIDQISLGLAVNKCPYVNRMMNDASRNKFSGEVDLAALDIERGREWGTPAYTKYRSLCGLGDAKAWSDLLSTHTQETIDRLQLVYADPRDIDLWTGIVSETLLGTSLSGPTQSCLIGKQFANIRDGDRFWYETADSTTGFTLDQLTEIKNVSLGKILCDNLDVSHMPEKVFKTTSAWLDCSSFAEIDLAAWKSA